MKFLEIFRFELFYQLRRPSTWIYFAVVSGLLVLVIDEIADYARNVEVVYLNAPVTVAQLTGYANKFGLLLLAALAGDGAMRDIHVRMDHLLYTTALSKITYLGARFLGTFAISGLLVAVAVPVSLALAHYTLNIEGELMGPFRPVAYLAPFLYLTLPNVFIASALLYAIVIFFRNATAAYIGALLIFVFSSFSLELFAGNWQLATWIDPFGLTAVNAWSNSLTPNQINTEGLTLTGSLLTNRIVWLSVSLVASMMALFHFQLAHYTRQSPSKRPVQIPIVAALPEGTSTMLMRSVVRSFDSKARLYQTGVLAFYFYREVMVRPAGLFITAIAVYAFILIPNLTQGPLGVPILPTSARITQYMSHSALHLIVVMLISLITGKLIWRERDTRISEIIDAVPISNGELLLSKYLSLVLVLVTLQLALMLAGIAIQIAGGNYVFDVGRYIFYLFGIQLLNNLLFATVAMAIHVVVNHRYLGHMTVLLFYLFTALAARIGIEHKLLIFGSDLGLASSTFYDQGPFLFPWILFKFYWAGWALLLMIIAKHMWVRGRETAFKWRFRQALRGFRFSSKMLLISLLLIVAAGAVILYNTNFLNNYKSTGKRIRQQVAYEQLYSRHRGKAQPLLRSTRLHIEFYPEGRSAVVQGTYGLKNSSEQRIDTIHLTLAPDVATSKIQFNQIANPVLTDEALGYNIYKLDQPLQPGDSLQLYFEIQYAPNGFSNGGIRTAVFENGTYFKNWEWLPLVGYQPDRELSMDKKRREHGLPKRVDLPSLYDTAASWDWSGRERIRFEAVLGTAGGQVAVAPGSLKKTWSKGSRQHFHYVADGPILNRYHIYSANYKVRNSVWNGIDIQTFHHPKHILNLNKIEQGIKASLEYYTKNFSPYSYRQLKFVEYPDPGTGGISLPGIIGYNTNFALLDPNSEANSFDLPFAVVAHEVAHQWWGHQLIPADVEGAPFLGESLARYSALGVIEQVHGAEHLRALLNGMRQEYLNPRSRAGVPLLQAADGFQGYRKGPFAMYALREYIGEKQVNAALHGLLKKFDSGEPPFATSLDFYNEIKAVTPDSLHYLLIDLFATNTFWDLKTKVASCVPTVDGAWLVTIDIEAQKVRVDKAGMVTQVPMNELIEIGIFAAGKESIRNALYLKKQRIHSGVNGIVVKVSEQPAEAGIDPRNLLIDTELQDNVRQVKAAK